MARSASEHTWHRTPREEHLPIDLDRGSHEILLPNSGTPGRKGADALVVAVSVGLVREVPLPDGTARRYARCELLPVSWTQR